MGDNTRLTGDHVASDAVGQFNDRSITISHQIMRAAMVMSGSMLGGALSM